MRILVTGASGQLGGYLAREVAKRGHELIGWSGRRVVDLLDDAAVASAFDDEMMGQPEAVIHAAAMARIGDAFENPAAAHAMNVQVTGRLAELCDKRSIPFIYCSTDMVFDGERGDTDAEDDGYAEDSPTAPLSIYGQSKLEAEQAALATPRGTVCRLSLLFGPGANMRYGATTGGATFFSSLVNALRAGQPATLFTDEYRTPLALDEAARLLVLACEDPEPGLFHVGGAARVSRHEMGLEMARQLGVDEQLCQPVSRLSFPSPEPRPADLSLNSSKAVARWNAEGGWRQDYSEAIARMIGGCLIDGN